jgi:hypothetical protein
MKQKTPQETTKISSEPAFSERVTKKQPTQAANNLHYAQTIASANQTGFSSNSNSERSFAKAVRMLFKAPD